MTGAELVTAADVRLMQGLAQRITAGRLDLVNSEATFGELAWNWGMGHARRGSTWPRRLWFDGGDLVAWGWAYLPHRVTRGDGSVKDVTGANLVYQVDPGHAGLIDEVIDWFDGVAAGVERTVSPSAVDKFALERWAAHGYQPDQAALADNGSWHLYTERDLIEVAEPVLPPGFRFRDAGKPDLRPPSRPMWTPGRRRRTRPKATRASSRPRGTAATCTSWSRRRTGRWPPRRSCGSTR